MGLIDTLSTHPGFMAEGIREPRLEEERRATGWEVRSLETLMKANY